MSSAFHCRLPGTLDPVCGITPGATDTFEVRAQDSVGFYSLFSNTVTVTFKG